MGLDRELDGFIRDVGGVMVIPPGFRFLTGCFMEGFIFVVGLLYVEGLRFEMGVFC